MIMRCPELPGTELAPYLFDGMTEPVDPYQGGEPTLELLDNPVRPARGSAQVSRYTLQLLGPEYDQGQ
jgi:hypothetical protein